MLIYIYIYIYILYIYIYYIYIYILYIYIYIIQHELRNIDLVKTIISQLISAKAFSKGEKILRYCKEDIRCKKTILVFLYSLSLKTAFLMPLIDNNLPFSNINLSVIVKVKAWFLTILT